MKRVMAAGVALVLAIFSCDQGAGSPSVSRRPRIVAVESPLPSVWGSTLHVTGVDLDAAGSDPILRVFPQTGSSEPLLLPSVAEQTAETRRFEVTRQLVDRLGPGGHEVDVAIAGVGTASELFAHRIEITRSLEVEVFDVPRGLVHRNDLAVVRGDGLMTEAEGQVLARFDGFFIDERGDERGVGAEIPVEPAEELRRDRGLVLLSSAIGGIEPGVFEGSIQLVAEMRDGFRSVSSTRRTTLEFLPPEIIRFDPQNVSLEQIVRIEGAGFLGGAQADEVTLVEIQGTFTPEGEGPMSRAETIVAQWVSGTELAWPLRAEPRFDRLVSSFFEVAEGRFEGTARVVTAKNQTEVASEPVPVDLELGPVRQVVWLRFMPGFYETLPKFGLAASAGVVERLVRDRIERVFDEWWIDVRLDRPDDFSDNGYAILDIDGPPPVQGGVLGFDGTPGKDTYNLRLYDRIGGSNWETQSTVDPRCLEEPGRTEDDCRCLGFGGVFIENFLWFSHHPELVRQRPRYCTEENPDGSCDPANITSFPAPNDAFDRLFDPVRRQPASLAEVDGEGDPGRVDQVDRALRGFATMVGTTAAHELGHSLGLANPYTSPLECYVRGNNFHNRGDSPGCLMDAGSNIPFEERAALPGAVDVRLCNGHGSYLSEILARRP